MNRGGYLIPPLFIEMERENTEFNLTQFPRLSLEALGSNLKFYPNKFTTKA